MGYLGYDEIAPPPLAQHAAYVFQCHTGYGRQIAVTDLLVEHDASRAGRLSDQFRQLEERQRHARLAAATPARAEPRPERTNSQPTSFESLETADG